MATPSCVPLANSPTLKRSFTAVTNSEPPSSEERATPNVFTVQVHPSRVPVDRSTPFLQKRRLTSNHPLANMPVAAGPQAYQSQFPSFMSVFGMESCSTETTEVDGVPNTKLATLLEDECLPPPESGITGPRGRSQHKHRDSTSTQASESTDSSPTTTISTADSSSLSDPSPGSSPESPITIVPLSLFSGTLFGAHMLDDLTMSEKAQDCLAPMSLERPMTSPSPRKPRNAKGLALNLPSLGNPVQCSAPSSPSFVKPPPPKPRKKPSLLSLQTSANPAPVTRLTIEPPTPGGPRPPMLRHALSTPLFSPNIMPEGGMRLPAFERSSSGLSAAFRRPPTLKESSMGTGLTISEEDSPIRTQLATRSNNDIGGDPFDAPASQEDAKSPGYPYGPIQIYEPNVYLYLEPSAEEASKFDVIMNVASEVKNPFKSAAQPKERDAPAPESTLDKMDIDRDNIPVPDTAASVATFKTAFEYQPESQQTPTESSPTTPKPALKEPEYIHVPWEHNTDITKDLMWLCETIEKRTKEGKRVLVHCQQGASRSASLIIAYGIYSNPSLSVNDAYHAAQAKSKWISPNMKLMYALQDFQKEVEKKKLAPGSSFKRNAGRSPTKHRLTLSADAAELSPKEPQTAPLPCDRDSPVGTPSRARGNSTPNFGDVSPGPSSAPSSFAWTPQAEKAPLWTISGFSQKSPSSSEPSPGKIENSTQFREGNFGALPHAVSTFGSNMSSNDPVLPIEDDLGLSRSTVPFGDGASSQISSSLPKNSFSFSRSSRTGDSDSSHKSSSLPKSGFVFPRATFAPNKDISAPDTSASKSSLSSQGDSSLPKSIPSFSNDTMSSRNYGFPEGPLSPPPTQTSFGFSESKSAFNNDNSSFSRIGLGQRRSKTPTPRMLPALKPQLVIPPDIYREPPSPEIWSPRVSEMTANPLRRQISFQGPSSYDYVPPTPGLGFGLMSPRATEFMSNPFRPLPITNFSRPLSRPAHITTTLSAAPVPIRIDPRSPAMKGEAPIIRSIDELL
jgi:tyrosine-protein phosphatase MSG5